MSSPTDIETKVKGIVSEQLNVPKEDIRFDSKFVDDLKADSLDVVELVMEFEEEFEITIPDEDYEKIQTVGDAVKYITRKLSG
uniref:Acyl carrier protein n=1 Tax=Schlesneria paludicola TaxID=360056 RepID=A0A7C4LKF0_9PLAN